MDIIIRKAKASEWEKVVDIYKREGLINEIELVTRAVSSEFTKIDDGRVIWFAETHNIVIGVIQLGLNHDNLTSEKGSAMLHHLRVSKDYEGKGIASKLIKTAEAEAKIQNIKLLNLEVERNNERAKLIYGHLGYKYTADGIDPNEIILTKEMG